MKFNLGDTVALASDSRMIGVVLKNADLFNSDGSHSVLISLGKSSRWMKEHNLRHIESDLLTHVPVPDGLVVSVKPGTMPVIYRLSSCIASEEAVNIFAETMYRMWNQSGAA